MLNKDKEEIDLKQTFEEDEDLNVVTVDAADDEAFSMVTNENELDGYAVEEPELDDYFGEDLFGSDEDSYSDDSDEM